MTDTKILSKKTVYQSKFFHIDQVEIERDGKYFKKDIINKTPYALIIPYTADKEIYLESQYRDAFKRVLLEAPAGKLTGDEEPLVAAKRELEEETGIKAKTWKHVATWELSPNMRQTIYVFFATDLEIGAQHLDEDEKIDLVKLPLEEALKKIDRGEMIVGPDLAAILLLDRFFQKVKI